MKITQTVVLLRSRWSTFYPRRCHHHRRPHHRHHLRRRCHRVIQHLVPP